MTRILNRIDSVFDLTVRGLVLLSSFILVSALTVLVVCRYFIGVSVGSAHDLSLFAAVWLYMGGVIMASRSRQHLVVDMLETQLTRPAWRHAHAMLISALTVIISVFFAFWVWKMLAWGIKRPQSIPGLGLPLWSAQAPIALAAVTAILYALRDLIRSARAFLSVKEGR